MGHPADDADFLPVTDLDSGLDSRVHTFSRDDRHEVSHR